MLFVLLQMCGALPKLVEKGKFQVCEGEYSVITAGKAAKCGSRILQHCMAYTVMRYGLPTSVCQRGFKTICVYIRLCFHKHRDLKLKDRKQYEATMTECVVKNTVMALSRFIVSSPLHDSYF
ncbi:uncharacterized protein LOC144123773 [Amblyomma americanum]